MADFDSSILKRLPDGTRVLSSYVDSEGGEAVYKYVVTVPVQPVYGDSGGDEGDGSGIAPWAPGTAYVTGQQVISPDNAVVSSKIDFTSGPVWSPNNWNYSQTFASLADVGAAIDSALSALPVSGGGNMNFMGDYDNGIDYLIGDVVTSNGQLLICHTAYTSVGGIDLDQWTVLSGG